MQDALASSQIAAMSDLSSYDRHMTDTLVQIIDLDTVCNGN